MDPAEIIAHDPVRPQLAVTTIKGQVLFFDLLTGAQMDSLPVSEKENDPGSHPGKELAYSPDGRYLAVARGSLGVEIWDLDTRQLHVSIPVLSAEAFEFSPDSSMIAVITVNQWICKFFDMSRSMPNGRIYNDGCI